MLNRMRAWKEKKQLESFFKKDAVVRLTDTSNLGLQRFIGSKVILSWSGQKLLIRLENEEGCITTSSVLDKDLLAPDAVVIRTANSTYRFCKYAS